MRQQQNNTLGLLVAGGVLLVFGGIGYAIHRLRNHLVPSQEVPVVPSTTAEPTQPKGRFEAVSEA